MLGPERKSNLALDLPVVQPAPRAPRLVDRSIEADGEPAQPVLVDAAANAKSAAKQALAEDLEGMIEGMLRNTSFATVATAKTRGWAQQMGEAAALDASTDDRAFTASSLIADLAQARAPAGVAVARAKGPRRAWIDVVLVLACLLSVVSAAYLTFAS
jgi:hypothetical protein